MLLAIVGELATTNMYLLTGNLKVAIILIAFVVATLTTGLLVRNPVEAQQPGSI